MRKYIWIDLVHICICLNNTWPLMPGACIIIIIHNDVYLLATSMYKIGTKYVAVGPLPHGPTV